MKRIIEARKQATDGMAKEEIDKLDETSFGYYEGLNGKPDYFPASIIQKTDSEGNTINDLRIFTEALSTPDIEIPDHALISAIKHRGDKRPKCMYCITMYNENFGQLLQSLAGCVRSI